MFLLLIELFNNRPGFRGMFRAPLNVFRYITLRTGGAMVRARLVRISCSEPWIIDHLRLRQGRASRSHRTAAISLISRGHADDGRPGFSFGIGGSTLMWGQSLNPYVWIVLA